MPKVGHLQAQSLFVKHKSPPPPRSSCKTLGGKSATVETLPLMPTPLLPICQLQELSPMVASAANTKLLTPMLP